MVLLHNNLYLSALKLRKLTSTLSIDESTNLAVPELDISSPKTFQGSIPARKTSSVSSTTILPKTGNLNSMKGSNHFILKSIP